MKSKGVTGVVFGLFLVWSLLAGCSRSIGATDVGASVVSVPVSVVIGQAGGIARSVDGNVRVVFPSKVVSRSIEAVVRPVYGVPDGNVGKAYGMEIWGLETTREGVVVGMTYDEAALPPGVDESDLALGVLEGRFWRALPSATVDVVSNEVSGRVASLGSLDVYGVLVRPYPMVLNASFDIPVMEGKSAAGWVSISNSPGAGGTKNVDGNNFFVINDRGQADSDPSVQQVVTGLVPGRSYRINGFFGGQGDCCGNPLIPSFGVAVDGRIILERSRPLGEKLVPFSATLLATSKSHTISFIAERNGEDVAYVIDDITIVPKRGFNLAVSGVSPDKGVVLSYPHGIDCGTDCVTNFASGSSVTLVATAASGFVFSGFSGAGCLGTLVCTVTMDTAKAVTATFSSPSSNVTLVGIATFAMRGYHAGGQLDPDFDPDILEYRVQRLEPGFITLVASAEHSGAVIKISGTTETSGQPFPLYFSGMDMAVPVEITAEDGQTTNTYTLLLCRWYCQGSKTSLKENGTL